MNQAEMFPHYSPGDGGGGESREASNDNVEKVLKAIKFVISNIDGSASPQHLALGMTRAIEHETGSELKARQIEAISSEIKRAGSYNKIDQEALANNLIKSA